MFKWFVVLTIIVSASTVHADAPKRIISLKPNVTEIIFALGAGDRLVGVTKYCDYPKQARRLPRVSDYVRPFTEKIIALSPDVIIGSQENSSRKSVEILRRMGFDVRLFPFTTIDEMLRSIQGIADAVGKSNEGRTLVASLKKELGKTKRGCGSKKPRRVLVVWGHRPLVVTGSRSFMGELLELVGAVNVAGGKKSKYPHWSTENVIASDPEIIIDMSRSTSSGHGNGAASDLWQTLSTVSAVRDKRIYTLDDSMLRAGPRLPIALKELTTTVCKD